MPSFSTQLSDIYDIFDACAAKHGAAVIKYLSIGSQTIRIISYAADFIPHMDAQWTFVLRDQAASYDATIVVWCEHEFAQLIQRVAMADKTSPLYRQWRINRLKGSNLNALNMVDQNFHHEYPVISIAAEANELRAWNPVTRTFYYAVNSFEPEDFIKHGHLCVLALARILQRPMGNLAHGAVVGLNGKGVLVSGMGYRGKSTLSVTALLDGFDYVSDDYIALEMEGGLLRAWPIYSIITLGPKVYQKLRPFLDVTFISNNGRKDKYVFNISRYHERFGTAYPVLCCVFPRFVQRAEPSIVPGDAHIATDEFIYSTLMQTGQTKDMCLANKLGSFIEGLPSYRFNLSPDYFKNTRCLREFLDQF